MNQTDVEVLYPLRADMPPLTLDNPLGHTTYVGPYEADHSTINRMRLERPTVLLFHVPMTTNGTQAYVKARDNVFNGSWVVSDVVELAGGPEAIRDLREQITMYAGWVRHCRIVAGDTDWFCNTPCTAAGTIVSYAPEEAVPERVTELFKSAQSEMSATKDGLTARPGRERDVALHRFSRGYEAVLASIAIGGVDGLPTRQTLWSDRNEMT